LFTIFRQFVEVVCYVTKTKNKFYIQLPVILLRHSFPFIGTSEVYTVLRGGLSQEQHAIYIFLSRGLNNSGSSPEGTVADIQSAQLLGLFRGLGKNV
jgi:hypothetical protein